MGVQGLWPLLEPAQTVTTLTALALTEFNATSRGFRIGIDASIWFFHAEYGKEGENPELRTLFFRCAQLISQGFLPLFVFDGPKRPDVKRGKRINKSANKLTTGMQAIIEAFGFEYRTAPGEAEAELAFLNRIGVIDGILSDDVDNFLFGAKTVVRNHSSTHAGAKSVIDKAKVITYTLPHPACTSFEREDLIFIALCSGGDYGTGLFNCGIKISYGLARAGFGRSLCHAATTHSKNSPEFRAFLLTWKAQLAQELRTNARGFLQKKSPKLAGQIPTDFPDIDVLLSYFQPITSETLGRSERYDSLMVGTGGQDGWLKKDPSLPMLAEKCEFYFEWGFMDSIIKRFRTVIFHGVLLRIMRRAFILAESREADANVIALDLIRTHFSSARYPDRDDEDPCPTFIKGISKSRTHASTSNTLEYRVEINPAILVQLTASGVQGTRRPNDEDEWAGLETDFENDSAPEGDSDDEGGSSSKTKSKKKDFPDPTLPLKLWVPAVMVEAAIPGAVKEYEEVLRLKEEKKNKKGKKGTQEPKAKSPRKPKTKPTAPPPSAHLEAGEGHVNPDMDAPAATGKTNSKGKAKALAPSGSKLLATLDERDSDLEMDYDELFAQPARPTASQQKPSNDWVSIDDTQTSLSQNLFAGLPPRPANPSPPSKSKVTSASSSTKASSINGKSSSGASKPKAPSLSRGGSSSGVVTDLFSRLDRISTPKRKEKHRHIARDESSSPEKRAPRPFPVSLADSDDDDYGDIFSDEPAPPGPPITPSPQKNARKKFVDVSSEDDEPSPRKDDSDRNRVLNKSPRKSKEHTYARGYVPDPAHEARGAEVPKKTIRDVPHPSRAARAASPTPARRTPVKSASTGMTFSSKATAPAASSASSLPAPRSKTPIIDISSGSDDDDEIPPFNVKPKSIPKRPLAKPLAGHLSKADLPNRRPDEPSSSRSASLQSDDMPPPPPQARARMNPKPRVQLGAGRNLQTQPKVKTVPTKNIDVIELTDSD